jgi:hypothetical protein
MGPVRSERQGARDGEQRWEADTTPALLYRRGAAQKRTVSSPLSTGLRPQRDAQKLCEQCRRDSAGRVGPYSPLPAAHLFPEEVFVLSGSCSLSAVGLAPAMARAPCLHTGAGVWRGPYRGQAPNKQLSPAEASLKHLLSQAC